jgi:hypothetical protein
MKLPDRISSKYFTENLTMSMRFQAPSGRKTRDGRSVLSRPTG